MRLRSILPGLSAVEFIIVCFIVALGVAGAVYAFSTPPKSSLSEFIQNAVDVANRPGIDAKSFNFWLSAKHKLDRDAAVSFRRVGDRNILEIDGLPKAGCLELTRFQMRGVDFVAVADDIPGDLDTATLFASGSDAAHAFCKSLDVAAVALVLDPPKPSISLKAVAAGAQRYPDEATGGAQTSKAR